MIEPTPLLALTLAGIGLAVGMVGSLLGVGGGVLLVPILVLGWKLPMHHAVGASLFVVAATSSAAGTFRKDTDAANLRLGIVLELATVLGALSGGWLAGHLSGSTLTFLFGLLLIPVVGLMWRSPASAVPTLGTYRIIRLPLALSVSTAAGALSGLLGVGGGIIKVPVLSLFCGVPTKVAVSTSNFMVGLTAVSSAFLYFGRGEVPLFVAGSTVLGVIAGALIGVRIDRKIQAREIRRAFALLLGFVSIQMMLRAAGLWVR